jgi:hypothetical protein
MEILSMFYFKSSSSGRVSRRGELAQTMYTHVRKCKNDKIKERKKQNKKTKISSWNGKHLPSMCKVLGLIHSTQKIGSNKNYTKQNPGLRISMIKNSCFCFPFLSPDSTHSFKN